MGLISRITAENESLLPAELRSELGIRPGDTVEWMRQEDGSYRIGKVTGSFDDIAGMLVAERGLTDEELEQEIDRARLAIGGVLDRA